MSEVTELRPAHVPAWARRFDPAETFDELIAFNAARHNRRAYLRVSFTFVIIDYPGVMLIEPLPRCLRVQARRGRMGQALVFNGGNLTPLLWAWTLRDDREL